MDATEGTRLRADPGAAASRLTTSSSALLAAAVALPGVAPGLAHAQAAPEEGVIALKYLDYRDWQPGAERMRVRSPGLYIRKSLSDSLAVEGTLVYDSISGASPLYFNTLSGASGTGITEYRTAGDVKITKYLGSYAVGVGAAVSSERDYLSHAVSLDLRRFSDDRNTTWAFGIGGASDRIDSVNAVAVGATRHTLDFLIGITQVLSAEDIVQSNVTYSTGHGDYSDPYKLIDARPDHRRTLAWLTRYNHHFPGPDATARVTYRYLRDSFGSDAHTVEVAWVQPLRDGLSITPGIRYTTQSAADFYFDPPFPQGFVHGSLYSADTRLSAFGAITPAVRFDADLRGGWHADLKLEWYRQRAAWHLGGGGSPGLEPFSARWIQLGIARTF